MAPNAGYITIFSWNRKFPIKRNGQIYNSYMCIVMWPMGKQSATAIQNFVGRYKETHWIYDYCTLYKIMLEF